MYKLQTPRLTPWAWRWMERAFSPQDELVWVMNPWGVAPGWYEAAPLALASLGIMQIDPCPNA